MAGKGKKSQKPDKPKKADKPPKGSGGDKAATKSKAAPEELSNKQYDSAMRELHVELVKLQEWVKHNGRSRSASCSRAATAPARAARSRRSPSG